MAEPAKEIDISAGRQLPDHNALHPSPGRVLKAGLGTLAEGARRLFTKRNTRRAGLVAGEVLLVAGGGLIPQPAEATEIHRTDTRGVSPVIPGTTEITVPVHQEEPGKVSPANPNSLRQDRPGKDGVTPPPDSAPGAGPGLSSGEQEPSADGETSAVDTDAGASIKEPAIRVEASASNDSLRTAIEARMKANPADAVFEEDYHGKNQESETAGAHLYQQIIAQLEEVDGPAKETATFFRGSIKAPINLLPGINPRVTNLVVLRSPDRETLKNEFPFAANAPFSVFVGVRGDDSPNRPQSVVQLYFIVIVNPDNQFGDMGADNAWLSLEAMQVKKQIELTQGALNKNIDLEKLTNDLPIEERRDLVRSINGATQSIASGLSDNALEDSVPKLLRIQASGKALFVDPSLAKLLDDYGRKKPASGN